MKALIVNCTLKASPEKSNTEALAEVAPRRCAKRAWRSASVRAVDHSIPPGVESEMGEGMIGPASALKSSIRRSSSSPRRPGSAALRASPRGALGDIGFTIPGHAWTYWNKGPGPGEDYSETKEGHEWSHSTGRAAAANLLAVARALEAKPIPAPPSK